MIRVLTVDWPALNAMRQQAEREQWPPITREELKNLCAVAGVEYTTVSLRYYQIVKGNDLLVEMDVNRSAREFIRAFQNLGLL